MGRVKGGYLLRLARINLKSKKVKVQEVKPGFAVKYLGGRGWGARIIWDEVPSNISPLEPENKLVITTGPLTGLPIPGAAKTNFSTISPATGLYGDSNVGGMWGTELKQAGYDGLILEKQAEGPTLLFIKDGEIEFIDAKDYWGMGSLDTEIAVKKDLKDNQVRVASIGPAGENLVKFACVTCDYGRQAGRAGMGTVMGSKKVKAIAVQGSQDIPVANMRKLEKTFQEAMSDLSKHKDLKIWQKQGTMQIIDWSQENDCLPTRNFREAQFEGYRGIDGEALEERTRVASRACYACPMGCGHYSKVRVGDREIGVEGPEYETAALLGSNCGISRIEDVVYANYLCDNLGIDTISAGNVTAFIMECFERGFISKEELGGLEPNFGNAQTLFKLLEMTANREGIGDLMAEGVKKVSQKIGKGSEKFAMEVKGLEISGYDSRAAQAMGLAYASADIGAHHNRAWAITYDIKVGRTTYTRDKVEWVIYLQHMRPLFDCLGTCRLQWVELGFKPEYYSAFYSSATGAKKTLPELLKASEMVYNLTRAINISRGLTSSGDWLPQRIFEDPIPTGVVKGSTLDREKFKEMIRTYYDLRGWNENGYPKREKLNELGLSDVATKLNLKE